MGALRSIPAFEFRYASIFFGSARRRKYRGSRWQPHRPLAATCAVARAATRQCPECLVGVGQRVSSVGLCEHECGTQAVVLVVGSKYRRLIICACVF